MRGGVAVLVTLLSVAAPQTTWAQKSISDGVDDLAAKLVNSFGTGTKGKVAIVPLRELAGDENLLGTYIAETLTNSFFDAGYRDIVERQMLDRAIQELKLKLTGMIDAESAQRIGKFLHAQFVVGGTMTDMTGDVAVNCRMFKVETGEVVAVAQTRLLKDDNVKRMMEKRTGSVDGSTGSGQSDAKPLQTDTKNGVRLDLLSCRISASRVTCSATMTQSREGYNHVVGGSGGSYISDMAGNQYPVSRVKLGAKEGAGRVDNELAANVPMRVEVVFDGVPSDLKKISALVVATYQQKFTFPNIDL